MVQWDLPNPNSSSDSILEDPSSGFKTSETFELLGREKACRDYIRHDESDEVDRLGASTGWLDCAVSYMTGWPIKTRGLCQQRQQQKRSQVINWKSTKSSNVPKKKKSLLAKVRERQNGSTVESLESMYETTATTTTSRTSVEIDDGSESSKSFSSLSSSEESDDSSISAHLKPKVKTISVPVARSPKGGTRSPKVTSTCSSISDSTFDNDTSQSVVVIDLTAFDDSASKKKAQAEENLNSLNAVPVATATATATTDKSSPLNDDGSNPMDGSDSPAVSDFPQNSKHIRTTPPPVIPSPSVEDKPLSSTQSMPRKVKRADPPATPPPPTTRSDQLKAPDGSPTKFRYGSPEKVRRDRATERTKSPVASSTKFRYGSPEKARRGQSPEKTKFLGKYVLPACPSSGGERDPSEDRKPDGIISKTLNGCISREPGSELEPPSTESTSVSSSSSTSTSSPSLSFSSSDDVSKEAETPLRTLSSYTTAHNSTTTAESQSGGSSIVKTIPTSTTTSTATTISTEEVRKTNKKGGDQRRRSAKADRPSSGRKPILAKIRPSYRPKNPYFT